MVRFDNQVDVIGGDANQHYGYHSKTHKASLPVDKYDSINGLFNLLGRSFVANLNAGRPWTSRLNLAFVDNNRYEGKLSQEDLDCMFVHILDWGKTDACHIDRDEVNKTIEELWAKYDENRTYFRLSDVVKYTGQHMSPEDQDLLANAAENSHPLLAPEDFTVHVSERTNYTVAKGP